MTQWEPGQTLRAPRPIAIAAVLMLLAATAGSADASEKVLLWGDTHVHTNNSFDAFLNRNMSADPATAYRFAKGLPVVHPYHRARVRIGTPLDFLVVADHAEFMGLIRKTVVDGLPRDGLGLWGRIRARLTERWLRKVVAKDEGMAAFTSFLPATNDVEAAAAAGREVRIPNAARVAEGVWQEAVRVADAHNEPGRFTTLIGWEWSSVPAGANLHRVVMTTASAEQAARFYPFSSFDSMYPEDLWAWLEKTSAETGARFVSIPHNPNISKGYMFAETSLRGEPISPDYARLRRRWEPVVEATQIKGDSETHPQLSPDDPFADFETYGYYIQQNAPAYTAQAADYVRPALLRGLAIERRIDVNPYRFGLIGSTDAHTGLSSAEEPNFLGKLARDSIPENKHDRSRGPRSADGWSMSASGLAAVWAESNTRDAILDAFERREVYATTGPRIAVRLFAGWRYRRGDVAMRDVPGLARRGVAMGGELGPRPEARAPQILVRALKDPKGAHLDRIQIVKGWIDASGTPRERVHDAVWSGDRRPDGDGVLPAVGNSVDLDTGRYTNEIGSPQLATLWTDPDFDPGQPAFYYARVLEIPTPRHSVLDALALGRDPRSIRKPWTIQERAYTSPVWYQP